MSETLAKTRCILVDKLGVEDADVKPTSTLQSLGADSLDTVEVVFELEKEFSISIPEEEAEKLASGTVQQIADYVVKKLRV